MFFILVNKEKDKVHIAKVSKEYGSTEYAVHKKWKLEDLKVFNANEESLVSMEKKKYFFSLKFDKFYSWSVSSPEIRNEFLTTLFRVYFLFFQ